MAYFDTFKTEKTTQPNRVNALLDPIYVSYDRETLTTVLEFTAKDWQINRVGILHGGLMSTMLDHVCGVCVATTMETWCPTVDLNVKFLRQAKEGDNIIATSVIKFLGSRMIHVEGSLKNKSTGKIIASCTSTYLNYKK